MGGFFGGRVDDVVMFVVTCRLSIPLILVALAVVSAVGSSLTVVVLTLGLLLWERFAVVARTTTMGVRNLDYIAAARAAGASLPHILLREVLPNIAHHLVVVATLEVALAILLEAVLSFLGLGVPPPLPSWGLMVAEGKDYMFFEPWVITLPGAGFVRFGAGDQPARRRAARHARRDSGMPDPVLEVAGLHVRFGAGAEPVRGAGARGPARRDALPRRRERERQALTALSIMGLLPRGARRERGPAGGSAMPTCSSSASGPWAGCAATGSA